MEDGYIASSVSLPLVDDYTELSSFPITCSPDTFSTFDDETSHARARRYTIHFRGHVRPQTPTGPAHDTMSQTITYNDRDIPNHTIANSDIG